MKAFATACLAATAVATPEKEASLAMTDDLINTINKASSTWTAGRNGKFEGMTMNDVKKFMGTVRTGPQHAKSMARLGKAPLKALPKEAIPDSFDVRTAWPQCAPVSNFIRDQSSCGSCWAMASTEAFNDRLCIQTNSTTILSTADTMACCNFFGGCLGSSGCDGGQPSDAWNYFVSTGLVTGGEYGQGGCYPYPFAQCSHHEPGKYPDCPSQEYNTPSCPTQSGSGCPNTNYATPWAKDLSFAKTSYALGSVEQIQTDVMTYGSATAAFEVYADFLTYKSGVYQHVSGDDLGGHAVKILGWGVENDTPYWLIANSWNQYWGDNGTFKILRGSDECGIEDSVVAGTV